MIEFERDYLVVGDDYRVFVDIIGTVERSGRRFVIYTDRPESWKRPTINEKQLIQIIRKQDREDVKARDNTPRGEDFVRPDSIKVVVFIDNPYALDRRTFLELIQNGRSVGITNVWWVRNLEERVPLPLFYGAIVSSRARL